MSTSATPPGQRRNGFESVALSTSYPRRRAAQAPGGSPADSDPLPVFCEQRSSAGGQFRRYRPVMNSPPYPESSDPVSFDPERGGRLLRAEGLAIVPVLRELPLPAFDTPTLLPGWSVRDVLAHCSAALKMVAAGSSHDFSPASNEQDVLHRRGWPIEQLLTELASGYDGGAAAVDAAAGQLDGVALGEWVHGGDVRQALGLPAAYSSEGLEDALVLLAERSRGKGLPATEVTLTEPAQSLRLGPVDVEPVATLQTDAASLIRLCAGRSPDQSRIILTGAAGPDYLMFS